MVIEQKRQEKLQSQDTEEEETEETEPETEAEILASLHVAQNTTTKSNMRQIRSSSPLHSIVTVSRPEGESDWFTCFNYPCNVEAWPEWIKTSKCVRSAIAVSKKCGMEIPKVTDSFHFCVLEALKDHGKDREDRITSLKMLEAKLGREAYWVDLAGEKSVIQQSELRLGEQWDRTDQTREKSFIQQVEERLDMEINIFTCDFDQPSNVRVIHPSKRKSKVGDNTISVCFLYLKDQYFYISNISGLQKIYCCRYCRTVINQRKQNHTRHERNCPNGKKQRLLSQERISNFDNQHSDTQNKEPEKMVSQEVEPKHQYKQGVFRPTQTPEDLLKDLGFRVSDALSFQLKKEFIIVFDTESYLRPMIENDVEDEDSSLKFTHEHKCCLIAAASNVPEYNGSVKVWMDEGRDEGKYIQDFLKWSLECGKQAEKLYLTRPEIKKLMKEFAKRSEDAKKNKKIGLVRRLEKVKEKIEAYARVQVIASFNGARYDMMTLKKAGAWFYLDCLDGPISAIPKGRSYLTLMSNHLRFVDILRYLGARCSLREFLKSYQVSTNQVSNKELEKQYFCYNYLSPDTVDNPIEDVKYEHFEDQLHGNKNSLDADYQKFQEELKNGKSEVDILSEMQLTSKPLPGPEFFKELQAKWMTKNIRTVKDLLIDYSKYDVKPLLESAVFMQQEYFNLGIYLFSHHSSVSSMAFHYAMKKSAEEGCVPFYLPNEEEKQLMLQGLKGRIITMLKLNIFLVELLNLSNAKH